MTWNPGWKIRAIAQARFKCERCGNCCTRPEVIDVVVEDTFRLAHRFHSTPKKIAAKHLAPHPANGRRMMFRNVRPCEFYRNGCSIYSSRPIVCRMAPFLAAPEPNHDMKGIDLTDMDTQAIITALVKQTELSATQIYRWLRYIGAWVN